MTERQSAIEQTSQPTLGLGVAAADDERARLHVETTLPTNSPLAADAPQASDARLAADAPQASDARLAADAPQASDARLAADAPPSADASPEPDAPLAPGAPLDPDAPLAADEPLTMSAPLAADEPLTMAAPLAADAPFPPYRVLAADDPARTADARLARLHLRGGLLALARAELEQMAGAGTLDREALADLAEARWRSSDTEGAAEAAAAHIAAGGSEPMALLVTAEALDRHGHLIDARSHSAKVVARVGPGLDRMFAGEERSMAWPAEAPGRMYADATAPGRWGLLVGGAEVGSPDRETWEPASPASLGRDSSWAGGSAATGGAGLSRVPAPSGARPWRVGLTTPVGPQTSIADLVDVGQAAGLELESIGDQVAAGDARGVPERLALLLRMDPGLAPVILSMADRVIGIAGQEDASMSALHLLRGDTYRVLGREAEALQAYQLSMRAVPAVPDPARATSEEST